MPFVNRILLALRTLNEDDPQPTRRRKQPNNGGKSNSRSRQTASLVLSFRDLFTSGGLNLILDEIDKTRRPSRRSSRSSSVSNRTRGSFLATNLHSPHESKEINPTSTRIVRRNQSVCFATSIIQDHQDEAIPLLNGETGAISCTQLVTSPPPLFSNSLFKNLTVVSRKRNKSMNLTVPLDSDDENKTVETLKKVLKWSPRKQNSAKFAVSLPREEEHVALAVVQNAVNRVKEEQQHKKKKKFLFFFRLC